jgi:hypothetical protein
MVVEGKNNIFSLRPMSRFIAWIDFDPQTAEANRKGRDIIPYIQVKGTPGNSKRDKS